MIPSVGAGTPEWKYPVDETLEQKTQRYLEAFQHVYELCFSEDEDLDPCLLLCPVV
jgi:hypothetical protein